MALGHVHPDLGLPPSVGGIGAHTGVSGLDMGGLGVPLSGLSQSGMGGYWCPWKGIRFAWGEYWSTVGSG